MMEFPPFRLDTAKVCLWRRNAGADDEYISLAPKAFAVLKYLVEHAGQVVSQNELLDALWPDTFVQPEVLKTHILGVRSKLGDSAKNPRFVETLPGQGYRFIAPVSDPPAEAKLTPELPSRKLVGRNAALAELRKCLERSLQDHWEIVFVTGEPGIGKTAQADEFLRRAAVDFRGVRMARGQCVEGFGSKETYYPMLEALGRLCADSGGDTVVQTLAARAPTWLVQFPALVNREQRETLQREILGATRERMLREIGEALETIASERPLLLVLEDLHWADPSTVDLISALARRRAPGKLMLIGTYRPVEVTLAENPLKVVKQDLLVHQLCREITLEPLRVGEVAEYLEAEARGAAVPEGLAGLIYRRTEGNPLFMVAALDHMRTRRLIAVENGTWQIKVPLEKIDLVAPKSVRQMIELQIERLSAEEQHVLEVMSLLKKFSLSVTIGSAVANLEPESLEELLEGLAKRHQVIRPAGFRDYRDGPSSCYEVVHVLYREVLYGRIGPVRRRKLHKTLAETAEALHVLGEAEVAAELAYQFEEGGDWPRAVKYLLSAADTAGRRFEPRQAAAILEHALELVNRIPEAERAQSEIQVLQKLATIYAASLDSRVVETYETLAARAVHYGLPNVEARALLAMAIPLARVSNDLYIRARDRARDALSRSGEEDTLERAVRRILLRTYLGKGKLDAEELEEAKHLVAKLREAGNRPFLGEVQFGIAYPLFNSSEYREALRSADEGFAILLESYEENPYLTWNFQIYVHLVVSCHWFLGEWGEALRKIEQRAEMAEKNGDRISATIARLERTWIQVDAMDFTGAQQFVESAHPVVAHIPSLRHYYLIMASFAEVGLGNYRIALEYLLKCRDEMEQNPLMTDWYYRMPLQQALAEVWLSQGELEKARVEGEEFLKITLATQEHTYRALALEVNTRVAIAERDWDRARNCLAKALEAMEGFEVPLAHWRVHATAAELHRRLGNRDSADSHRELSRATILKLANSLPSDVPLRKTFLSAPVVSKILGYGGVPGLRGKKLTPAH